MSCNFVFNMVFVVITSAFAFGDVAAQEPPGSARPEASPQQTPVEVTVRARRAADLLRHSAQSVSVIDTEQARRGASDLGEVLARTEGITVQRAGGLGSVARLSLQGFDNERVRFFLDGVPLASAGFTFGLENVPVNLIERVEVYRGVVPIRFGADALGGAIQLVSKRPAPGAHGGVSYQGGSFDTHRLTLTASERGPKRGLYALVTGFADWSQNDYPIRVRVTDPITSQQAWARVHRFHDAYAARGAALELGVLERPWAERLSLRTFVTHSASDLQHDLTMVVPYGEATAGTLSAGSTANYRRALGERGVFELLAGYSYGQRHRRDLSMCIYDWYGRCVAPRAEPGEIARASEREPYLYTHAPFARAYVALPLWREHLLSLSVAPTYEWRDGEDRSPEFPGTLDPLRSERQLWTIVTGVAYQLRELEERLEAELFVKQYTQLIRAEELVPAGIRSLARDQERFGAGAATRFEMTSWLAAKASYEWATRLPNPDELFGDGGITIDPNLELRPELSHNLNLELLLELERTRSGSYRVEIAGFLRRPKDFIRQTTGTRLLTRFENLDSTKVHGVQTRAWWSAPGELLTLDGSLTYQDIRNTSETGDHAYYYGDRIPNRPYLFGSTSARLQFEQLFAERDQLWLSFTSRCTGRFDRSWESVGANDVSVPRQVLHFLALTYLVRRGRRSLSSTIEIANLSDARAYDFFGVQRPGRAVFFKGVAEL